MNDPMQQPKQKLILASSSPYRAAALERLGLTFSVHPAHVDESPLANEPAHTLALRLAHAKAAAIAIEHPQAVVIGSDQVGQCDGILLGKPGSVNAAVAQLSSLSGKTATFYSAVAIHHWASEIQLGETVITQVRFRRFCEDEARIYVELDHPIDCAGSFKAESLGICLFEEIQSADPTALIGLPIIATLRHLRVCRINPLQPA